MTGPVTVERVDTTTVIRLDDGKANAVSHELLQGIHGGLDAAEEATGPVLLLGRDGKLSAGFDLTVLSQGPDATRGLVGDGARLLVRLLRHPAPVVVGCTGHAVAMGALVLLAADLRIGAEGPFKIGLNEVAIGMSLPGFGVKLATERLSKRHLMRSVNTAEIYDPAGAVDAGFLDRTVAVDAVVETAAEVAAELAQLSRGAYAATKLALRGAVATDIEQGLDHDMSNIA